MLYIIIILYWCFTILIEVYLDAYASYTAGLYRCRDKCTHTHSKYYNYINAYSLIPRPCRRKENWHGIDYSRICELRSNFSNPSIIILLFIPLVQSKMLSQGFVEASIARIVLSSYPLSIHSTKIHCWVTSGKGVSYSGKQFSPAITTGLIQVSTGSVALVN